MLQGRHVPGRWTLYRVLRAARLPHDWLYPLSHASYSQHGEDRLLVELLHGHAPATYIDVGAHHPRLDSDTFLLYKLGWRGLAIDADPQWEPVWRRERPRDRFATAIVDVTPRDVTLYLQGVTTTMHADWARPDAAKLKGHSVTLQQLLADTGSTAAPGLLKIDIEGLDLAVLESLDTTSWRPACIVVETHHWTVADASNDERLGAWCQAHGYELVAHNRRNVILADSAWLRRRFEGVQRAYATLNPALYAKKRST